jgi:AP-1 complex subunit beta-1
LHEAAAYTVASSEPWAYEGHNLKSPSVWAMAVNRIKGAFQTPKKGETFELRAGLVSQYAYERKEAIQKTIMSMTLGKDVSALFPDVLKNIATPDLDQKKLVYLYLMYARSKIIV